MATLFLAWELGAGLAHVMQLLPFAQHFAPARGHRVFAAVCKLPPAGAPLGRAGAQLLQARCAPTPAPACRSRSASST